MPRECSHRRVIFSEASLDWRCESCGVQFTEASKLDTYRWRVLRDEQPPDDGMYWARAAGYTGAAWYTMATPGFFHDGRQLDADLWAYIPSMSEVSE